MSARCRAARVLVGVLLLGSGCGEHAVTTPSPPADGDESLLDAALATPAHGDAAAARALHEQALAVLARDEVAEAHRLLEAAIAADPAAVAAHIDLGFLLLEGHARGSFGGALREFRLARLLEPHNAMAACGEGITRRELGDLDRAEPLLREALAAPHVQAERGRGTLARAALAAIAATRGRRDEALAGYAEVAAVAGLPPCTRASYLLARCELLVEAGADAPAAAELAAAIVLDPENPRAHLLRSQLCARRGDAAGAAQASRIHELLRALQDHTVQHYREDDERTLRLRTELVAAWPDHFDGAIALVQQLLALGRFAQAHAQVAALVVRGGATPALHELAARARAGVGDLVGAKEAVDAIRYHSPQVRTQFLRTVLADWQRGDPSVSDAAVAAQLAVWGGS